jgi:hypothetical protein
MKQGDAKFCKNRATEHTPDSRAKFHDNPDYSVGRATTIHFCRFSAREHEVMAWEKTAGKTVCGQFKG